MKKKFLFAGVFIIISIIVWCFICLPTNSMQLSKAKELQLNKEFAEAFQIYHKLANEGNSEAMYYLARCYGRGMGVNQSDSMAWKLYKKSAELGFDDSKCVVACAHYYGWYNLAQDKAKGWKQLSELYKTSNSDNVKARYAQMYNDDDDFVKDDRNKFCEIILSLSESSDPYTLRMLGVVYSLGEKEDGNKSVEYFTKAFENGDSYSAYNLARIYYNGGYGIKIDIPKSIEWLKKGIDYLSTDCMIMYGTICINDEENENCKPYSNPKLGVRMFEQAAKLNDGSAYERLGRAYTFGWGVEINSEKATANFKKAMELGDANGALNYSANLLSGRGCTQNIEEGRKMLLLAEKRGSGEASMRLFGEIFNNGWKSNKEKQEMFTHLENAIKAKNPTAYFVKAQYLQQGIPPFKQDSQEAFSYMKKAADAGHPTACAMLANYYREGIGCSVDMKKAKEYQEKSGN